MTRLFSPLLRASFTFTILLLSIAVHADPHKSSVKRPVIAIAGASGQLGHLVVAQLKEHVAPKQIVALVRTPSKAEDLEVEVRKADYTKPETLESSLVGVDKLLLISSNGGDRVAQHRNVIEAAKKAKVSLIVYTSILHADRWTIPFFTDHIKTEQILKDSGVPYVILRNGWYTENYVGQMDSYLQEGVIWGNFGNARLSTAPRRDYAAAAVVVLTGDGHARRTYELAGDTAYTFAQFAATIQQQTGRALHYENLSDETLKATLTSKGSSEEAAAGQARLGAVIAEGILFDDSGTLSRLIQRPTVPLAEVVSEALKN